MNLRLTVGQFKKILAQYPENALMHFSLPEKSNNIHNADNDYLADFSGNIIDKKIVLDKPYIFKVDGEIKAIEFLLNWDYELGLGEKD